MVGAVCFGGLGVDFAVRRMFDGAGWGSCRWCRSLCEG